MKYHLAVDVGGTWLRAALYPHGETTPARRERVRTPRAGRPETALVALLREIWPADGEVLGVGVASPGPLDPRQGLIFNTPNIPAWRNFPLRDYLARALGVPVMVDNDANLAALGEWRYGAGRGHRHLLYLTISTGIGAGVIVDGRLLHGARGLAAELGHVTVAPDGPLCGCGQRGHLEAIASGTAIARQAEEALARGEASALHNAPHPLTAADVAAAAQNGDPLAQRLFAQAGEHLGRALAGFLHIFNPSIVILGGGVVQAGDVLLRPLEAALRAHVMTPAYLDGLTLTTAALGDDAGLMGALAMVRTSRLNDQTTKRLNDQATR